MPNAYFFRIGMDTTNIRKDKKTGKPIQGIIKQFWRNKKIKLPLGMVFLEEYNDFVYIPLIKYKFQKNQHKNRLHLSKNLTIGNKKIWKFICNRNEIKKINLHYDPCFNYKGEYSYGDVMNASKSNKLELLKKGDLLIFCASLKELSNKKDLYYCNCMQDIVKIQTNKPLNLYVIGYFVVGNIEIYSNQEGEEERKIKKLFKNNAHVLEKELNYWYTKKERRIFIKGTSSSKLLKKAIKIASPNPKKRKFKIDKNFQMYIGKNSANYHFYELTNLNEKQFTELKKLIDKKGF